jgi:deoxyribonuclease V
MIGGGVETPSWPANIGEARALQVALREQLVLEAPADFAPRTIAGADVSMERFGKRAYAGIVVLDADTLEVVDQSTAVEDLRFPYIPGYLSFRELPPLDAAWRRLQVRPDVVVFDAQGTAHPRRFGLACHGGLLWDVPALGCAKNLLVGEHDRLGDERGSVEPLRHQGEVVGAALRTRDRVKPLYVSPGHRMDLQTALRLILGLDSRFREPETTRRAHALVNAVRRADPDR